MTIRILAGVEALGERGRLSTECGEGHGAGLILHLAPVPIVDGAHADRLAADCWEAHSLAGWPAFRTVAVVLVARGNHHRHIRLPQLPDDRTLAICGIKVATWVKCQAGREKAQAGPDRDCSTGCYFADIDCETVKPGHIDVVCWIDRDTPTNGVVRRVIIPRECGYHARGRDFAEGGCVLIHLVAQVNISHGIDPDAVRIGEIRLAAPAVHQSGRTGLAGERAHHEIGADRHELPQGASPDIETLAIADVNISSPIDRYSFRIESRFCGHAIAQPAEAKHCGKRVALGSKGLQALREKTKSGRLPEPSAAMECGSVATPAAY